MSKPVGVPKSVSVRTGSINCSQESCQSLSKFGKSSIKHSESGFAAQDSVTLEMAVPQGFPRDGRRWSWTHHEGALLS